MVGCTDLVRCVAIAAAVVLVASGTSLARPVDVEPHPVQGGEQVTIQYNPSGRVLDGAQEVYLHFGFDDWSISGGSDRLMLWNGTQLFWEITVDVPDYVYQLDFVFRDGNNNWDNNSGSDWHLFVIGGEVGEWDLDGQLDDDAFLIAESGGYSLYAGVRGSSLYLAAPAAISGNDHFIFLAETPGGLRNAPWDKSGDVANWSAYLGQEADNGWIGWFEAGGSPQAVGGTWMEGTIDLIDEFGSVPDQIHIAFAPYPTSENTTLLHNLQVPASTNYDGNVDANEYEAVLVESIVVGSQLADIDDDGDVDLDDYGAYWSCLLGPGVPSCDVADLDRDGDVDLADFALFQVEFAADDAGDDIVAEDLGPNVTRFYPADVSLDDLPPSLSMEADPIVVGPATAPWEVRPFYYQAGGRQVALIPVDEDTDLYGTGEVCGSLLRTGQTTEAWNTDAYGYGENNPSLYQSHPWVLGVRSDGTAFGVLADTTFRCRMDLTIDIVFAAEGPEFPVYVFEGDSPQEVITRLTDFIGRISLPPIWALGYQQSRYSYAPDSYATWLANEFRVRDIPCDVIWFDIDYMDGYRIFTFDPVGFPDPVWLNNTLHASGFHTVWMIDPGVKVDSGYFVYDQGSAGDHWIYNSGGSWYTGEVWPGDCHFPDFTRPETRAWWADLYTDYMATGIDGVWNDMNEPGIFDGPNHSMPLDCQHRGGGGLSAGSHSQYHNVYGRLMVEASHEGIAAANPDKRPFVLSRANFIGGHRYAAMWTGDNLATWEHLYFSTPMVLNLGISAQPFAGPDLGGFSGDGTADLFARWMGVGVFMPFCRAHNDNWGIDKEPWSFGTAIEDSCRTSIQRRYRLIPYLYTLFREAAETGLPVARPVFFADPTDLDLREEDIAFMLGSDLLIVPNVSQDPWFAPTPFLPDGVWRTVSLVGEDSASDFNQPDVRVRPGAIIPLGPVMEYTQEVPLDPLTLIVNLDESGSADGWLYEDAGDGFGYLAGEYRLAHYSATELGNNVTIEVVEIEGSMPTPARSVVIEILTDGGTVSGAGTDVSSGVVGVVTLP